MAAATADREAQRSEGRLKAYGVAADTVIHKGTLVGLNADGYLVPMADEAGLVFAGLACDRADNGGGADGARRCRVYKDGEYELFYAGGDATAALAGREVLAQDDQTVDEDAGLTDNDYVVGAVTEVVSPTRVRVRIDNYVR
jgi:hypothetical protein